jgi:hypothetical protein
MRPTAGATVAAAVHMMYMQQFFLCVEAFHSSSIGIDLSTSRRLREQQPPPPDHARTGSTSAETLPTVSSHSCRVPPYPLANVPPTASSHQYSQSLQPHNATAYIRSHSCPSWPRANVQAKVSPLRHYHSEPPNATAYFRLDPSP